MTRVQPQNTFDFYDLAHRVYMVTGAANGLGRELAFGLAGQGCNLILVDRDEDGLRETGQDINTLERGARAWVSSYICDLADAGARQRLCEEIKHSVAGLDGLIHNAGIDPRCSLENTSVAFFRNVIATNVEPALELTRDLLPMLRKSSAGRVVMIGSATLEIGTAYLSSYVASKGALVGLTRSLAHELGSQGITVNCISPGALFVEKEAVRRERASDKSIEDDIIGWQSVPRALMPSDILGPLCLLLSECGGAISGQTIQVDGGLIHPMASSTLQSVFEDEAYISALQGE